MFGKYGTVTKHSCIVAKLAYVSFIELFSVNTAGMNKLKIKVKSNMICRTCANVEKMRNSYKRWVQKSQNEEMQV